MAKRREQTKIQTKQQERKIWQELSRISLQDLCIRAQNVGVDRSLLDKALQSERPKHQVSALVVEREMLLLQAQPVKLLYSHAQSNPDGMSASASSLNDICGEASTKVELETEADVGLAHCGMPNETSGPEDAGTSGVWKLGPQMQQDQQVRTGDSGRGAHRQRRRQTLRVAARTVVASLRQDEDTVLRNREEDRQHSDVPTPLKPSEKSARAEKESSKPPAQRWGSSARSTRDSGSSSRVSHSRNTSSSTSSESTSLMRRGTYVGAVNRPCRPASAGVARNIGGGSGGCVERRVRVVAKRKGGKMVFEEVPDP